MSSTESKSETRVADRVAAARRELEDRMAALGLTRAKGWDVLERVVDSPAGCTWMLLPVHLKGVPAPDDLCIKVPIDGNGEVHE